MVSAVVVPAAELADLLPVEVPAALLVAALDVLKTFKLDDAN